MASGRRTIFMNQATRHVATTTPESSSSPTLVKFHQSLPSYSTTPLVPLDDLARELGVGGVFVKDESSRLGLPSFKILGASWGTFRAIALKLSLPLDTSLSDLSKAAAGEGITLFTATDGNHGRAVARMAKLLQIKAKVFVPKSLDQYTRDLIAGEGAEVVEVVGDYDRAVQMAAKEAMSLKDGILVQDTSFEGYEEIPSWIVQGYSTMLREVDSQLDEQKLQPTVIVTPVGVGSLAHAVVNHCKADNRSVVVLATEPDTAACLHKSLKAKKLTTIKTSHTIMSGMECGSVSATAWPALQAGVDVSTTVSDFESHQSVQYLASKGVNAGPCGAATLAALRHVAHTAPRSLKLTADSVVVLLSTEGSRPYATTSDVSTDDAVTLTQILTRINSSNPALSLAAGAGEAAVADYIASWLEHRDFEVERLEAHPGRPSIVSALRGTGGGKSLMLNGHMDTTSLASYSTTADPLSGEMTREADGSQRVHGRGSLDMKAGLAAAMTALAHAKSSNQRLKGDVILCAVADEENMSLGTEETLKAGLKADGAIVTEPTFLNVGIAHKGFVWVQVDILGVAAHGSRPHEGIDAILLAGEFQNALRAFATTLPEDSDLGRASLHAGLIQGGEEPSSYPALCRLTVEFRTVPPQTAVSILADVETILAHLKDTVAGFNYAHPRAILQRPYFKLPAEHAFVQTVTRATTGENLAPNNTRGLAFWCDAALIDAAGIPVVVFGPSGAGMHSSGEWVDVDSVRKVEAVLKRVIGEFCG